MRGLFLNVGRVTGPKVHDQPEFRVLSTVGPNYLWTRLSPLQHFLDHPKGERESGLASNVTFRLCLPFGQRRDDAEVRRVGNRPTTRRDESPAEHE
jgi:hypothetical protein